MSGGLRVRYRDEFTFAKAQAILADRGEHAKRRGNTTIVPADQGAQEWAVLGSNQ
jgi:hypothetical protein